MFNTKDLNTSRKNSQVSTLPTSSEQPENTLNSIDCEIVCLDRFAL